MNIFQQIEWGTMLYSLFIFIILFLLLRKFAFGPLMNIMEKRAQKIEDDLAQAEKYREEAKQYLEEQREALEQARREAQTILENARLTSEKQADEIKRLAKEEAEQLKNAAIDEINREKEQAIEALRSELGSLTVALASKVIEKELDAAKQEALIADYLKEVGTKKWVQ